MSAIVIGCVPPGLAVVIYFMNRPYIMRLFVPGIGLGMLIIAVVMTLAGIFALRKITQIDI
jgi:Flp pilus assembly protein TadB